MTEDPMAGSMEVFLHGEWIWLWDALTQLLLSSFHFSIFTIRVFFRALEENHVHWFLSYFPDTKYGVPSKQKCLLNFDLFFSDEPLATFALIILTRGNPQVPRAFFFFLP